MQKKLALLGITILVFLGKYLQIFSVAKINTSNWILTTANAIILLSFILIIVLSAVLLGGRWRLGTVATGITGLAILGIELFINNAALYTLYNLFLITSLFLLLYPFHHYEIKKFAAFGYAFFVIYVMMEGTSLWYGNANSIVFFVYLTLTLIMFVPGILKIRKEVEEETKEEPKMEETVEVT